jgi:hypothetical protein
MEHAALPINILGISDISHHDPCPIGSKLLWFQPGVLQGLLCGVDREHGSWPHLAEVPLWDIRRGWVLDPPAKGTAKTHSFPFRDELNARSSLLQRSQDLLDIVANDTNDAHACDGYAMHSPPLRTA